MRKTCFLLFLSCVLSFCLIFPAFAADPVPVEKIILNESSINLPVKAGFNLKATFEPKNASNKKLDWTSSDENIATVKNGKVVGINPGTATITAIAQDGSGVSASAVITVVIPVKKITLSETRKLPLAQWVSWKISAVVEPYEATMLNLEWSSSNEKVALVDQDGVVTALEPGTSKITASAVDGSKVKASVDVVVSKYDIVFTDPSPQTVTYSYGSGYILVDGNVKTGCVSIPDIRTSILALIGKEQRTETVSVKPVKPGEDVVTIKAKRTFVYKVFVSPEAVPGSSVAPPEKAAAENEPKELLFMNVPWGASYPDAQAVLKNQGITLKSIVKNNDHLRAMIVTDIPFANVSAYRAGLNFSYDENDPDYEKNNSFFSGYYYFMPEVPFEEIQIAVRNAFNLDKGVTSGDTCTWKQDDVLITLTRKDKYTALEFTKNNNSN